MPRETNIRINENHQDIFNADGNAKNVNVLPVSSLMIYLIGVILLFGFRGRLLDW